MSSYLVIENFQGGLDTRKALLAAPAGTLTEGLEGHITPGAEFEKRKAFVSLDNPGAETDSLEPGTFGLQPVANKLMVFGSGDLSSAQWPNDADGNAVLYQRLQHPAVLAGETYDAASHAMKAVIHSEVYEGKAFVIAQFEDSRSFCYFDGVLVGDFTAGLVLPYLDANSRKLATHIKGLVDALPDYSAVRVGPYTSTHRAHSGNTATLTIGTHSFQIGDKVWVTGVNANYAVTSVAISGKTPTTISYPTVPSLTEGTTADTSFTVESAVIEITGAPGIDYEVTAQSDTAAGTVTGPTNSVAPVSPVTGAAARGAFTITGGAEGATPATATGKITRTATNASAGDFVQIGKKKYTFRATPTVEGDVDIGVDAAESLANLKDAINHEGSPGSDYVCAWPHPWVKAGTISGNDLPLTVYAGSHGNSVVLTESTATVRFSVTAFSGGAGNCVGQIRVMSPTGTDTDLLTGPVAFTINASATAAAVRDAIVLNSGTSGYTATVNENTVTVLSAATASPMPNGYHLEIACGGNVLVGDCLFYLQLQSTTFGLNDILVDGLNCLAGAEAFPQTGSGLIAVDTLPEYYEELVYVINSRAGITGINAWTNGEYVKLSRITTRDDDEAVAVTITPTTANTVAIIFGTPPPLALPLTVTLPERSVVASTLGEFRVTSLVGVILTMSTTVVPTIAGGNGLFTYSWIAEYPGLATGTVGGTITTGGGTFGVTFTYAVAITPPGGRAISVRLEFIGPGGSGTQDVNIGKLRLTFPVRLEVTDSFGNKALSNACNVEFEVL